MSDAKTDVAGGQLDDYRQKIAQAYDGEIFGAEFFDALAIRYAADEVRRGQLEVMRDVELATAEILKPLVARLGLPKSDEAALKSQAQNAAGQVKDWGQFVASFRKLAPGFVATFEAIVAIAPPQDRAVAQFLVDHEVAFVDFTEEESAGDPQSVAALQAVLKSAAEVS